jgi:energy-coupling factor transport system substrate-specific component
VSWQVASFGLLACGLTAGFAWYERSRPDARIVALVATMAALAALGRIAFAALPNVKPTTDIVLITGYTLGGAPGFVVGAVAGLVSNFFFGQGPWTAWQMGAWAATGVFGAVLARATRGRVRRWPLAVVCAVVGYAFAAFQDVGDWVTYSDHSVAQLGVYVGQGTGFDLVHAGGCLAFALAFGPALMHSLTRFQRRLEITWRAPEGAVIPILFLAVVSTVVSPPAARSAATPTDYLLAAQNGDGGFGSGPGLPSVPLFSGWTALGLAANGVNPGDVRRGGQSLLGYIESQGASFSDVGSLERTILVARAAGVSASAVAGRDLVGQLKGHVARDGSVSEQVNLTAFAVLALRAAGSPAGVRTVAWLRHQQNSDGGFGFATAGAASDVDDTGAALEALAGTGPASARTIGHAVGFLRAAQNGDGGLPEQPGGPSDAQSTAWAIQGLLAAGVDPGGMRHRGRSPVDYLRSLVAGDGHVRYAAGNDQTPVWVTAQAAMALAGKPLPLAPVPVARTPAPPARHTGSRPPRGRVASRRRLRPAHVAHPSRGHRGVAQIKLPTSSLGLDTIATEDETSIIGAITRVLGAIGVAPA